MRNIRVAEMRLFFVGVMKVKKKSTDPKQPKKCKSCVWGTWTGTKQYCSMPFCVRE